MERAGKAVLISTLVVVGLVVTLVAVEIFRPPPEPTTEFNESILTSDSRTSGVKVLNIKYFRDCAFSLQFVDDPDLFLLMEVETYKEYVYSPVEVYFPTTDRLSAYITTHNSSQTPIKQLSVKLGTGKNYSIYVYECSHLATSVNMSQGTCTGFHYNCTGALNLYIQHSLQTDDSLDCDIYTDAINVHIDLPEGHSGVLRLLNGYPNIGTVYNDGWTEGSNEYWIGERPSYP